MIHQYARHTNSGDKCYKNIQKVQEKRQLQQTTELCITGLWTVDLLSTLCCWGLRSGKLCIICCRAEGRAGPKQSAAAGHRVT